MQLSHSTIASFRRVTSTVFVMAILLAGCINDQELEFNPHIDIPPACSDGLKNQDETAVDCGGACSETCGDEIVAECSAELKKDQVYSADDWISFMISGVSYSNSYDYGKVVIISAVDEEDHSTVEVVLPLSELPAGNMKFLVAERPLKTESQLRASVTIDPFNEGTRTSITGTIYVRTEGRETIHIEFCDILFEPEYTYYDQNYYKYSGHFSFKRLETGY